LTQKNTKIMMTTIFILIYLISFAIHLLLEYRENKRFIRNIGDLIDNIQVYMWFPLLNTLMLMVVVVGIFIMKLWKLLKLDILWEKFRNIKLK
jgi:hypothetical protein